MPSTSTINVSLTPELNQFVHEQVASGRYQSAGEVVCAGLRLLKMDKVDRKVALDEVRRKIQAGLDQAIRGELLDGDQVFRELEERIKQRRTNRQ